MAPNSAGLERPHVVLAYVVPAQEVGHSPSAYFFCPWGCVSSYKKDGHPYKNAKRKLHKHGVGNLELGVHGSKTSHCHRNPEQIPLEQREEFYRFSSQDYIVVIDETTQFMEPSPHDVRWKQ